MGDRQRQNEARRIRLEERNRRKRERELYDVFSSDSESDEDVMVQLDPGSDIPTIDEFPSDIPSAVEFEGYRDDLKIEWAMNNYDLVRRSHPDSPDKWNPPTEIQQTIQIRWAKEIRNELDALKDKLNIAKTSRLIEEALEDFLESDEDDMDMDELRHINLRF